MSGGPRRHLADLACRALQAALPPSQRHWGSAVRRETDGIPDDGEALRFALGALLGLTPRAIAWRLSPISRRPLAIGAACAIGAVALGSAYMTAAGAPGRHVAMNAAALALGLASLVVAGFAADAGARRASALMPTMAAALLATALLGDRVGGAARWVSLGGLPVQPSLILLPAMLVAFARDRRAPATAGIIAAVVAIALQPDRAMAGALALGLAALAAMRPERQVVAACVASFAGVAATVARADAMPATPFVDGVLKSSFDFHPAAGMAVLVGSALLPVPAIVGWHRDSANRASYAAFGASWCAASVAAAVGNHPTPLVGYGGSAIVGYALSLLALPRPSPAGAAVASGTLGAADRPTIERHLLVGPA